MVTMSVLIVIDDLVGTNVSVADDAREYNGLISEDEDRLRLDVIKLDKLESEDDVRSKLDVNEGTLDLIDAVVGSRLVAKDFVDSSNVDNDAILDSVDVGSMVDVNKMDELVATDSVDSFELDDNEVKLDSEDAVVRLKLDVIDTNGLLSR